MATRLGLPGIPAVAESVDLSRDLLLVEATGVRAHFQQISSRDSLRLLRAAKRRGLPVTADVSIQHLLLDESALEGFNSHCHVIPPLRSAADREALLEAVADGTIDAICSQHTPIGSSSKAAPFPATKPGMAGLDVLLSLVLQLVDEGKLDLLRALDAVTAAPARCLGIQAGQLETGRPRQPLCAGPGGRQGPLRRLAVRRQQLPLAQCPAQGQRETDGVSGQGELAVGLSQRPATKPL